MASILKLSVFRFVNVNDLRKIITIIAVFQFEVHFFFTYIMFFSVFPFINHQVCGEKERLATVRGCKWVDEVVENVPYVMSDEYLRWVIGTWCEENMMQLLLYVHVAWVIE